MAGQQDLAGPGQRELALRPTFLMCYDDHPKRTIEEKIAAALAAYAARFHRTPDLVWVNTCVAADLQIDHVVIERRPTVPPNHIWVGTQPAADVPSES